MKHEEIIDQLQVYYTGKRFIEEVKDAKRVFFENAGVLDEASDFYELRMSQFLDWYLFTRDLMGSDVPPVVEAFRLNPFGWSETELNQVKDLVNHRHSLFDLIKIRNNEIRVRDLFDGDKLIVRDSLWATGFDKGAIFEARLVPTGNTYVFTRGICFHPEEGRKFILSEIKKCRHADLQDRRRLMMRLMKLRYKYENYRHVSLKEVYSDDSKLRV